MKGGGGRAGTAGHERHGGRWFFRIIVHVCETTYGQLSTEENAAGVFGGQKREEWPENRRGN